MAIPIDSFVGAVPTGENQCVTVYRRHHNGRDYCRWRVWHRHKTIKKWYPDKRRFGVLRLEHAAAFADVITAAAEGEQATPMPDWLTRIEEDRDDRIGLLVALNAPDKLVKDALRKRPRGYAEGPRERRSKPRND